MARGRRESVARTVFLLLNFIGYVFSSPTSCVLEVSWEEGTPNSPTVDQSLLPLRKTHITPSLVTQFCYAIISVLLVWVFYLAMIKACVLDDPF